MTHAEFHAALKAIAAGRYFSSDIKVSEHPNGVTCMSVSFAGYIEGVGCRLGATPASVLEAFAGEPDSTLAGLAPLPAEPAPRVVISGDRKFDGVVGTVSIDGDS